MKEPLEVIEHEGVTIAVGDTVRVKPTRKGGHDGYTAVVRSISRTDAGEVDVEVAGIDTIRARDARRSLAPGRLRKIRAPR